MGISHKSGSGFTESYRDPHGWLEEGMRGEHTNQQLSRSKCEGKSKGTAHLTNEKNSLSAKRALGKIVATKNDSTWHTDKMWPTGAAPAGQPKTLRRPG